MHDGVPLRLVPHEPDNGYRFYVSDDGTIGLQISPSGVEKIVHATPTTCENCTNQTNAKRKQRYLQFKHKGILAARAVYLAWSGKPIPDGHQVHHLTGITTDNRIDNLLCLSQPEHRIADARQKTLKTVVPEGNLKGFDYAILRDLQDPHTMSDDDFKTRMEYLRVMCECGFDPRIFAAKQFHYWFSMPFEEFKTFFYHYKNN